MAVHKMTGHDRKYIWHQMSTTEGNHFYRLFWNELDSYRKINSFSPPQSIHVVPLASSTADEVV